MLRLIATAVMLAAPVPAWATEFKPVSDKSEFLSLVQDRELRIGLYRLSLAVLPDGQIKGSALGWSITGSWAWKDGYFCREMDWSGMEIDYDCQLVEAQGAEKLRFTVDQGAGDSAVFRLR
ncbi:MAG: dihydrodipicolinate reductase [Rhodobacter sp.]|nr:dihydrodipicolinate reductase [Rhodobacter sp.]